MLEIFRKNLFINSILLLPYIFIVRIGTLINPILAIKSKDANILQSLFFDNISSPLAQNIVANLIIFVHALLINFIFINHKLSKEITLFAGLFYVLFISLVADNMLLSNVLIANTFIILAFKNLLDTYKNSHATSYIFNTGFMIGMASLFYAPYFVFIILGMIALFLLRSFKAVEKLQFLIGFLVPYFFLFTYRYWNDIPFVELNFLKEIFFKWPEINANGLIVFYVSVVVLLMSVILSIINYGNFTAKKPIQTQKKIDIIYWMLLFCLISFLIFDTEQVSHLLTLAIPLSFLVGISVSDAKNKIFYELVHLALLSLIFIAQFKLINF